MCELNLTDFIPFLQIAERQQDAVARAGMRVNIPGVPETVVAGAARRGGRPRQW